EHSLEHLELFDPTERVAATLLAPLELDAEAVVLCFTGIPRRRKHGDDGRAYRYLYHDAGAAAQVVMVAACAMGLATNFVADCYDDELAELLQLDVRNEHPLCLVAVGW